MKKIAIWIENYLTNNGKFDKSNTMYRKVYLLNAILTIMLITCSLFIVIDIVLFSMYVAAIVNAVAACFALFTLIYFKKTNKYKVASYIAIAILAVSLASLFEVVQNKHYAFYWLSILPPITYFLLDIKQARLVVCTFALYMVYFILSNIKTWGPVEFDAQSIYNILGASISLVLMIAYYERSRKETSSELNKTILQLVDSKENLNLILDSAAEAIYGIDINGICTFCNKSCVQMLGYNNQSDLMGKNMHWQIHHSKRDGSSFPVEDCMIFKAYLSGEGSHVEDEVFWRADGTSFDVEYYSYPQKKNGKIIGAVITFMDITERKQREAQIQYLNYYDTLTGLRNKRYLDKHQNTIDIKENFPLSVIFADIDGLKMTNDIFGHSAGNELIKKSSVILKEACRDSDLITRIGGDEFIILLPKTSEEDAGKILDSIRARFSDVFINAIKCSLSLGLATKISSNQSLDFIINHAENAMYKDKTMSRRTVNKNLIDSIVETLHEKNPRQKQHSISVSELCAWVGTALNLAENEISKLSRAGYLHDIGKIVMDDSILTKNILSDEEIEKMQQHSAVGYRILSLFDETLDLAEYVYGHHERWDGKGYPRGLKGREIPMISRIIAVTENYDHNLNREDVPLETQKQLALDAIKNGAGTMFDPQICDLFINLISKKNGDN